MLGGKTQPDSLCDTEYPSVRAFVLAPGVVRTRLFIEAGVGEPLNTVALPAATTLYLTSGRADWLSGRFVDHYSQARISITDAHALPDTTQRIGTSERWSASGRMRSSSRMHL